jgi:hypothetical protein
MKDQTKFRVLLTVLSIIGLAFAVIPWETLETPIPIPPIITMTFTRLLPKFGEAIVIAVILALVVDQAAKRRLLEEFARNVSTMIIGRRLPPDLRKYIEQYLETDLIRTHWSITYTITEWEGQPDYKKLVTLSVYEMENRSTEPQEYECNYEVETSFFPDIGKTEILHITGTQLVDPHEGFDYPNQPGLQVDDSTAGGLLTFSHAVTLPVHEGPVYRFSLESVECFRDGSIVPFFANHAVLATTLTVFYPVGGMSVFLDLSFGDVAKDAERISLSNGVQWVFKKPMLRGQGFSIRFAKITSVTPAGPATLPAASLQGALTADSPPASNADPHNARVE